MFAVVDNNRIVGIYCGNKSALGNVQTIDVPDDFAGIVGQSLGEFDEQFRMQPLSKRVADGYVVIPKELKLVGEEVLPKDPLQRYVEGIDRVPEGKKLVDGQLVDLAYEEFIQAGLKTEEEAQLDEVELVIMNRRAWYFNVGDPLFFKEQRGEVPAGTWVAAVEKMRELNPYPEGYSPVVKQDGV